MQVKRGQGGGTVGKARVADERDRAPDGGDGGVEGWGEGEGVSEDGEGEEADSEIEELLGEASLSTSTDG